MNFLTYNLYSVLLEIFILVNICTLILFGSIISGNKKLGYPLITNHFFYFIFQIFLLSLVLIVTQSPIYLVSWNNLFISDSFTHVAKIIILITLLFWLFLVRNYTIQEKINNFEYWLLILLSTIALFLIIQAYDLLTMYVTLEFQSLIFYILTSFNRTSEFSTEAGIKYFVLGAFSSALLLFGSVTLYNLTGLTNLNDFSKFFMHDFIFKTDFFYEILLGITFILISFLFKLSAAPFHVWSPDVYEGSPTSSTLYFAIIPKITILALITRTLILTYYNLLPYMHFLIIISILLCAIIGTFTAFAQLKWKRFITYSSISHISFFLITFLVNDSENIISCFIYLIVYIIMSLAFFAFFIDFRYYVFPVNKQLRYLTSLTSLKTTNPLLSISLIIIFFSMAGIPPLAGFFSKFIVLSSAIQKNIFGLVFFILFFNCISCFYYLRLIKTIYFQNFNYYYLFFNPLSKLNSIFLGLCIYIILFMFFDLEFIFTLSKLMTFSFIN